MGDNMKDIPSMLPLAPGGVYSNKWEERVKYKDMVEVVPVDYTPPFKVNPDNPVCFLEFRSGGHFMGQVTLELKADTCPIACDNFKQLCEFKCYTGSIAHVWPGLSIKTGDFTERDPLVWHPEDPESFDFDRLLPNAKPGGQSIYMDDFADENFDLQHAGPGAVSMASRGPNTNASQFQIALAPLPDFDGRHVVFAQVLTGYEVLAALSTVGSPTQDGTTFQRVSVERCGVVAPSARAGTGPASAPAPGPSSAAPAPPRARGAVLRIPGGRPAPTRLLQALPGRRRGLRGSMVASAGAKAAGGGLRAGRPQSASSCSLLGSVLSKLRC